MKKQQNNRKNVCKILTLSAVMLAFVFTTAGCRNVMLEQLLRNKKYDETTAPNKLVSLKINGVDLTEQIQAQMRFTYDDIGTPDGEFVIEAGISKDAKISYDGAQAVKGTKNAAVSALALGETKTVIITVRPKSGSIKNYVILFRNQESSDAKLTSFAFNDASITGGFSESVFTYDVKASAITVSIKPDAVTYIGASIVYTLDGTSHTAGTNIDLVAGTTRVLFAKVKAASGAEAVYTFKILKDASTGAKLTAFAFSSGATVNFNPDVYNYAVTTTSYAITSVVISTVANAVKCSDGAAISYSLDGSVSSPTKPAITFSNAGETKLLVVKVTAQSGDVTVYTFSILRQGNPEAQLKKFGFTGGALDPAPFVFSTYNYAVNASSNTVSINTGANLDFSVGATISYTIDGTTTTATDNTTVPTIGNLTAGVTKVLFVRVTSQSGGASTVYTFNILWKGSDVAELTGFGFSTGFVKITPVFDKAKFTYAVEASAASIAINTSAVYYTQGASISYTIDGGASSSALSSVALTKGTSKTLVVSVTSQSKTVTKIYTFNILWPKSNEAWLTNFKFAGTNFNNVTTGVYSYAVAASSDTGVSIKTGADQPTASTGATITYSLDGGPYGSSVTIGTLTAKTPKVLVVKVTSESGTAINYYTFNILWAGSDAADLMAFSFTGTPAPVIAPATIAATTYNYAVDGKSTSIKRTAATVSTGATAKYFLDGVEHTNPATTIALTAGTSKMLVIKVTSESGAVTNVYAFNIKYAGSAANLLTRVDFTGAVSPNGNWYAGAAGNVPADRYSFNIYTTAASLTASNITASTGATKEYSFDGGSTWTTFTATTIPAINNLTVDGAAKTLIFRITPQSAATPNVYIFNIRRYESPKTYDYTGVRQVFVMPFTANVTFDLYGAEGGEGRKYRTSGSLGIGGLGGQRTATSIAPVSAGTIFYVYVGQRGIDGTDPASSGSGGGAATYGGGGAGNTSNSDSRYGGSGGGATFISTAPGTGITDSAVADGRIVVAGGGGGGGDTFLSSAAGSPGLGAEGSGVTGGIGTDGLTSSGAGGGGGGYYGGIGGGAAGAKGGSGYSTTDYTATYSNGVRSGNGQAIITVVPPTP